MMHHQAAKHLTFYLHLLINMITHNSSASRRVKSSYTPGSPIYQAPFSPSKEVGGGASFANPRAIFTSFNRGGATTGAVAPGESNAGWGVVFGITPSTRQNKTTPNNQQKGQKRARTNRKSRSRSPREGYDCRNYVPRPGGGNYSLVPMYGMKHRSTMHQNHRHTTTSTIVVDEATTPGCVCRTTTRA